jgi:hypothetical protein
MSSAAGELGWRGWTLLVVTLGCAVAAFLVPAMPQPLEYHDFADKRAWLGIANFQNVASNLPFLIAGGWGLSLLLRGGGNFIESRERLPYVVFFLGALLTCFGSGYYHLAPANAPLVWDRLPMTLGFAGLVSAALAERVHLGLGLRLLWALLALGVLSVSYWAATERAGAGNVMPYGIYQGWSVLVIVLLLLCYPARRYDHGYLLIWAAVWYGLAKLFETFDDQVHALTGGLVSGHAIKHVLAALGVFAIVWQLRLRRPMQAASIPAA